ncbi:MAG: SDR family NAD(P)-dependent oxidoreductase [Verrucomicrobiota bacterium]
MTATPQPSRVVLITGAAGGLGKGLVAAFLEQGWRVMAGWHQRHAFTESDCLIPVQWDVTCAEHAQGAVGLALKRWGRVDMLVNNAGLTRDAALVQMKAADWEQVLGVNLKGAFLCSQAVLRPMLKQRDGHILNVTSFAARTGTRGQANYAAAKAGLLGLTESLAREVGARNIRVNAVLPGVLLTPMTAGLKPEVLAEFEHANTLGRLNSIEEVARFMVFLAGTRNISGQLFQLDSRIASWS